MEDTSSMMPKKKLSKNCVLVLLISCFVPLTVLASGESRLPDVAIPLQTEGMERTTPLFEAFAPFLSTGDIKPGFEIPTGAIWQPGLLVWGDFRSALQQNDNGNVTTEEWSNRLNLFAQLKLTGTERVLMSVRPLDEGGRFSGYRFKPDTNDNSIDASNDDIRTLFFEGDFGEVFPNLDPDDSRRLDLGFAIGRQPLFKQEGILVNDTVDAIGIVRNSGRSFGASNVRVAALYSWNEVNRNDRLEDSKAELYGLFSELDFSCCTVNVDLILVDSELPTGGGSFIGVSSVQRFGHINTSFRLFNSTAEEADNAAVSSGSLFFFELSTTPPKTDNNYYLNGFVGIDQYSPAALDFGVGGPLARTGILFAGVGLGSYGSPLDNNSTDVFGSSLGYQMFFSGGRQQLIAEIAFRKETKGLKTFSEAAGLRYQQASGLHTIYILDGFVSNHDVNGSGSGMRAEVRFKF
jgi:hypothetical protein